MALQDWAVVAFHLFMWIRIMAAPDSPEAVMGRRLTLGLLCPTLLTLLVTRGQLLGAGTARALLYRVGMFAPMVGSYFTLRWYLPALQPHLLDAALLRIDEVLFGATPAVYMDSLVTSASVEWFAFFYYSHFYVLGLYLLPSLFFDSGRRMYELMIGAMLVIAIGHTIYTLVPGLGPYAEHRFDNELTGGFWWAQVQQAVAAAGAQLDIFPSLHTACPCFFSLHAIRYRHTPIYRYLWLPTSFIALNILIATMFLRWHYGIDVIAGVALALTAHRLSEAARRYELGGRRPADRQPVWEALWPTVKS
ncbi:MAG: phosphatase PAP2 family protein [Proteobacteria bacterium]|nr:phosphatase PAP2 family protein [Pseudomonadota bacterium]